MFCFRCAWQTLGKLVLLRLAIVIQTALCGVNCSRQHVSERPCSCSRASSPSPKSLQSKQVCQHVGSTRAESRDAARTKSNVDVCAMATRFDRVSTADAPGRVVESDAVRTNLQKDQTRRLPLHKLSQVDDACSICTLHSSGVGRVDAARRRPPGRGCRRSPRPLRRAQQGGRRAAPRIEKRVVASMPRIVKILLASAPRRQAVPWSIGASATRLIRGRSQVLAVGACCLREFGSETRGQRPGTARTYRLADGDWAKFGGDVVGTGLGDEHGTDVALNGRGDVLARRQRGERGTPWRWSGDAAAAEDDVRAPTPRRRKTTRGRRGDGFARPRRPSARRASTASASTRTPAPDGPGRSVKTT